MNFKTAVACRKMYPHHPMQKWERVMVAVFVVLMFAGLILSFHQTAEDGHTIYAEKIEIGYRK